MRLCPSLPCLTGALAPFALIHPVCIAFLYLTLSFLLSRPSILPFPLPPSFVPSTEPSPLPRLLFLIEPHQPSSYPKLLVFFRYFVPPLQVCLIDRSYRFFYNDPTTISLLFPSLSQSGSKSPTSLAFSVSLHFVQRG